MLYLKAVAVVNAMAGVLARTTRQLPAGMKILRALPIPGKRLIVCRLSPTGLPSLERARVGHVLYDLDLQDPLQRAIYFKAYEKWDLRRALRHTPAGGVCMDIGACVGYYAMNLARKAGTSGVVHAFEPDSENHERLVRNCVLNGLDGRVLLSKLAFSNLSAEAVLHRQPGRSGDATLSSLGEDLPGSEWVKTDTVDAYVKRNRIDRIDFVKIDVTGYELKVLEGSSDTLKLQKIRTLLVGFNGQRLGQQGHSVEDLLLFMSRHGYAPIGPGRVILRLLRHPAIDPRFLSMNILFAPANKSGKRLRTLPPAHPPD